MTYPSTVKYLLIGQETSWATGGTADKDCGLRIADISTPVTKELIESQGMSDIAVQEVNLGLEDPGLEVSGDFQHGRLLEYVFGTVAHATTSSDTKHTFTINNTPPSMKAEVGNNLSTDVTNTIIGLLVESAEIRTALNENVQLSVTLKGKSPDDGTSASTAVTSSLPVFPHSLVDVEINGASATEVQEASITIEKVVSRSGGIGSNVYQQGHGTSIRFTYSARLGFQSNTFHELFNDDTVHTFKIQADNGVVLGSGRREISITLGSCVQTSFNEISTVGELTFIEIEGSGTLTEAFSVDNIASGSW